MISRSAAVAMLRRLASSDVTVIAFGQLLQQALMVITGIAVARMLGSADYGLINIVRNIFTALAILAPIGLDLALLKYMGRASDDTAGAERLVARLRLVVLAINLPVALIGGLGLGRLLMAHIYVYPKFDLMLLVTLLALPVSADLSILGAYYRARGRPGAYALMSSYVQPIARLVLVAAAFWLSPTALAIITINTLQILISAAFVWTHFTLWRRADRNAPTTPLQSAPLRSDWAAVRMVLADSSWMALNLFVYGMMRFVDVLVLGAFAPAKEVGAYAALSTIAQLVQVWPFSASQTLGPNISRHYHAGDVASIRRELNEYIQFAAIVAGYVFAGVAAFGTQLNFVFGKSFVFGPVIALLLPLGWLLSATLAPVGFCLSMTGRHRAELAILTAGGGILLLTCYLFTPLWGSVGAASSVCLTFALINITRFYYVSRTLGFTPGRLLDIFPPIAAAAFAYGAKALVGLMLEPSLLSLLLGCGLYSMAFAALAYLLVMRGDGREAFRRLMFRAS
ncbi:lipopolysaccharide biosynthesis protein [Phenylobacterium montanum]|uniref:Lipopolysaccharide biosynthesis protein n=1 Tax=Phenylobacterium montanum TaxID=2823693 RepID=A0A975IVS4_9CAUL|nr:lipopolysaccharide biosynthesis protein [Caulobacter sp. S6]QUD89312.1 lipopolysaccharide biosynthesis protein [Caulobacter sp. S6]